MLNKKALKLPCAMCLLGIISICNGTGIMDYPAGDRVPEMYFISGQRIPNREYALLYEILTMKGPPPEGPLTVVVGNNSLFLTLVTGEEKSATIHIFPDNHAFHLQAFVRNNDDKNAAFLSALQRNEIDVDQMKSEFGEENLPIFAAAFIFVTLPELREDIYDKNIPMLLKIVEEKYGQDSRREIWTL